MSAYCWTHSGNNQTHAQKLAEERTAFHSLLQRTNHHHQCPGVKIVAILNVAGNKKPKFESLNQQKLSLEENVYMAHHPSLVCFQFTRACYSVGIVDKSNYLIF